MSMVEPSIDVLTEKVDSKYTLVILASKRARELQDETALPMVKGASNKPVTIALEEVGADLLTYERTKSNSK